MRQSIAGDNLTNTLQILRHSLRRISSHSWNHSQTIFLIEIWRQNHGCHYHLTDFFWKNMVASSFCHDRKSALSLVSGVRKCQKIASLRIELSPYNRRINDVLNGFNSISHQNLEEIDVKIVNFYWTACLGIIKSWKTWKLSTFIKLLRLGTIKPGQNMSLMLRLYRNDSMSFSAFTNVTDTSYKTNQCKWTWEGSSSIYRKLTE